jgi:hypothetical protein
VAKQIVTDAPRRQANCTIVIPAQAEAIQSIVSDTGGDAISPAASTETAGKKFLPHPLYRNTV